MKKVTGLNIELLSKVRKEIKVIRTTLYEIRLHKIDGGGMTPVYCVDESVAIIIANRARLELARRMAKREPRTIKDKITNI